MEKLFKNLKQALFLVFDLLLTLASLLLLVTSFLAVCMRAQNKFLSFGIVQSRSMENSGLYVGDVVFARREESYRKGDVIVFYRLPSLYGFPVEEVHIGNAPIWIHEIVDEATDELGRRTYLTKGSSNAADDGAYVPEDFILGKAKRLPTLVSRVMNYLSTAKGVWLLVVLPAAVLLVYLVWDFVLQILTYPKTPPEEEIDADLYLSGISPSRNAVSDGIPNGIPNGISAEIPGAGLMFPQATESAAKYNGEARFLGFVTKPYEIVANDGRRIRLCDSLYAVLEIGGVQRTVPAVFLPPPAQNTLPKDIVGTGGGQ